MRLRSLSRTCGGGLGWGQPQRRCVGRTLPHSPPPEGWGRGARTGGRWVAPTPTLPRKRRRELSLPRRASTLSQTYRATLYEPDIPIVPPCADAPPATSPVLPTT